MVLFNPKTISLQVLISLCFVALLPAQTPKRIISVSPSITKQIFILEKESLLIGCSIFCKTPGNTSIPIVASAMDINVEKIALLNPDLVLASEITKPESVKLLQQLGIKVEVILLPKSFKEICSGFIEIGQLLGIENKASLIIENTVKKIDSLQLLISADKSPKVFIEIGAKPLFTAIPNTFMDDHIKYSGGINIANDLKRGSITRESVIIRNPDVIIIVTMGIVGKEEKETWMDYPTLNAAKNKKIFILDADRTCSPDPISFAETVEEMIGLMY